MDAYLSFRKPDCLFPDISPGPLISKSFSAIKKPSFVSLITFSLSFPSYDKEGSKTRKQ